MKFGVKQGIAVGILVIAGAVIAVLVKLGVRDEIWSTVAANAFIVALAIGFGGKCRMRCRGADQSNPNMEPWPNWLWF